MMFDYFFIPNGFLLRLTVLDGPRIVRHYHAVVVLLKDAEFLYVL